MEKISITKKDSVPRIVEKILESSDNEIVLSVHSNSVLRDSLSDMELIAREAEAAGKFISIDSNDSEIIELAGQAGIPTGSSPVGKPGQLVSDIIVIKRSGKNKDDGEEPHSLKPGKSLKVGDQERSSIGSFWNRAKEESRAKKQFAEEIGEPPAPEPQPEKREKRDYHNSKLKKLFIYVSAIFVLLGISFWVTSAFFGKAEVSISFKKIPWQYQGAIIVSKTFSQIDASKNYLPGEVFTQQKNITRIFPASGNADVSQKATARITIYNAYSSSKQTLVATTRFAAPDGKIFRLDNQVVVPGAGIKDGKIVPSSIEASVTADKAGVEYNVGPFDKLTIPGFKGTPRYEGFYGVMPQAATGGFVGKREVPTDQDIAAAKDKTSQGLRDVLQSGLASIKPEEGFKIIDGASLINITKLAVNKNVDDKGNFSIFGEASLQSIGFREKDINSLLETLMLKDNPGMSFDNLAVDYQNVKPDFAAGQLAFSVSAKSDVEPEFSEDELRTAIAGKSLADAKASVLALPDLGNAKISLWPFWLGNLPNNAARIKINWN